MDAVIAWLAQDLLWVMVAGFAAVWLFAERRDARVQVGAQAVVGLILAVAFLYVAKSVHHDPRPFVENPRIKPLFGHSRDDGFPSDHSVAAGLIATLVLARHRVLGAAFAVAAFVVAWARVAAHVHHLQDVLAGLFLGGLAAVVAVLAVSALLPRLRRRHSRDLAPQGSR